MLIAFPLAAPVFDGTILEPVATTWGSALGAIAAVAGAYWVAGWQASQQRRTAAALVHTLFYPVTVALNDLSRAYGPPSRAERGESDAEPDVLSAEDWRNINRHAKRVVDLYGIFKSRIHRYEAALNLLSASSLVIALDLETELEEVIQDVVKSLAPRSAGEPIQGRTFYGEPAHWSIRFELTQSNQRTQAYMLFLQRQPF